MLDWSAAEHVLRIPSDIVSKILMKDRTQMGKYDENTQQNTE